MDGINGSAYEDVKLVPNAEINGFAAKYDLIQHTLHDKEEDDQPLIQNIII